ncbi:MAG: RagB/SusD family nutrient uptake outer membrane protein [Candidatus Symbiothrix sp.]|nr:RagB/SusD family nutrient uptake outer membrane protein [Candidatus Symbiothrix sp.]
MKHLVYVCLFISAIFAYSCSDELLDVSPSSRIAKEVIFENPEGAQIALNGIYRALFANGWSDSWSAENPGMMATTLVKDLQGEDHLMQGQGNGWFYYDYAFWTDGDYTTTSGRQYAQWNFYYTVIAQANYVIAEEEKMLTFGVTGKNVIAQAYALRGLAYTALYEWFCQGNYAANSDKPGVPIYTEPTTTTSPSQPRGTVEQVFIRINADFEKSVELFEAAAGVKQAHPSHLDVYATYLLWARVALIQENWPDAGKYAEAALDKAQLKRVASLTELGNFNNCRVADVLWGFEVIVSQSGPYGPYLSHMDPEGGYGSACLQSIDAWLWNNIPDTDARKKTWWGWTNPETESSDSFVQVKFRFSSLATSLGDLIYLRAEEALLIAAEALCRQDLYSDARELLLELGENRDSNYAVRLAAFTDDKTYKTNTHGALTTLMDEILFQRRVELWSEGLGRAFDLRRLNLGYNRDYIESNHTAMLSMDPGDVNFVTLIPQKEFDSNDFFTVADQNPR